MGIIFAIRVIMKPKSKVLISLIGIAIFGYALVINDKDSPTYNNTSFIHQSQSVEFNSTQPHQPLQRNSDLNRDEVLKKSLKGYREKTYWGSEHPIIETTKDLNDKEFNRFLEDEIKSKDADIYWGAEY